MARHPAARIVAPTTLEGTVVAKPNYAFEKRQRELAKKRKKEEKQARKAAGGTPDPAEGSEPAPAPPAAPAQEPGPN